MHNPAVDAAPPAAEGRRRFLSAGSGAGRYLLSPWLATLLGLLCFANSVGHDFTYDDRPLVLDNPRIRTLTDFRAVWLSDWWEGLKDRPDLGAQRDRLYRPLTLFTFALNYAVHECHPAGYHLLNIALHGIVCFLLWHFARRLVGDPTVASVAAVLFAVHPVHAEAVAGIVGRAEVLAALFLLVGLLLLQPGRYGARPLHDSVAPASSRWDDRDRARSLHSQTGRPGLYRALLAALAFLAALLSKETAVCYPAMALLTLYATPGKQPRSRRWWLMHAGCLLLPLLVYFPLRYVALEDHLFRAAPADVLMNPLVSATPTQRVAGAFTVLGHYTRLLAVPNRLCADYGLAIVDPAGGFTVMTLVGLLAAGGLGLGLFGFTRQGPRWRQVAVLSAMILAGYALISNTALLIGVSLAERLMYWPSAVVLILVAVGVVEFWRRQCISGKLPAARTRLLQVLGVLLVLALGLWTAVRNADWVNNVTLFTRDVTTNPQGAFLNKNCAVALMKLWKSGPTPNEAHAARWAAAERYLRRLNLWGEDWTPEHKRAALLEAARRHLSTAIRIHPGFGEALSLRGQVRAQLGDQEGARADLNSALLLIPNHREARETLAKLSHEGAPAEQRLAALRDAVAENPTDPARRLALGQALLESGRYAAALEQIERAAELEPDNAETLRQLGVALALAGENKQAIEVFRRLLTLNPDDWQVHANLTTLLSEQDSAAALLHARRAYELQPNDLRSRVNLAEAYVLNERTAEALKLYRHIEHALGPAHPYRPIITEHIAMLERGVVSRRGVQWNWIAAGAALSALALVLYVKRPRQD
ncbi:MAG: tetratricopeptide repeat protein [Phycisphaerae bacterium]|nr:tetratricopeptide repeat protein [Phycisphaerae bacterium]